MKLQIQHVIAGLILMVPAAIALAHTRQVTREEVRAALPRLERLARQIVDRDGVPGMSIAVVYRDEVLYLKGFGAREVGRPEPVDADTVFQLASLSKPIASTAVAALVSDGKVTWDTRIAEIDPEFRLHDAYPTAEVTIRDFFAHRSGLWGDAGNDIESLGFSRQEILSRLRYLQPGGDFRAHYAYSNFGLTEGALAAAKAAGVDWEVLAEQKVYQPLGMTSTSSRYADFLARTNRASLHVRVDGKWQPMVKRQPDAQAPAGGVSSSARDLAAWVRLQLGEGSFNNSQLIGSQAIAETHQPVILRGKKPISGEDSFYGLGWAIDFSERGVHWAHGGAFSAGARTAVDLLPSQQLGIVILSNAFPSGVPEAIAASFFDFVFDGRLSRDWVAEWNEYIESLTGAMVEAAGGAHDAPPTPSSPALPLAAYTGTYANEYVGEVAVIEKDGSLRLRLGPGGGITVPLKHFDRDLFLSYPSEEAPSQAYPVRFTIGADGKASEITIDAFNANEQGALKRRGT